MKTVVITGANAGIGYATAQKFIQSGHHVILACRNQDKAQQAKQQLLQQHAAAKVDILQIDLNSLSSVIHATEQLKQNYEKIDVLVNNAGLMATQLESTEDGFEKQIGVNYIGPYVLTHRLLPLLEKSEAGRIINLASMMHVLGNIHYDQFQSKDVQKYNGVISYGNSKLANLLFSNALAEKLKGTSITSNALHPGGVDSEIYRDLPKYQYYAMKPFLISPKKPADLIAKIALDESWAKRSGDYVSLQTPAFRSRRAKNPQLAQDLYHYTHDLLQEYL